MTQSVLPVDVTPLETFAKRVVTVPEAMSSICFFVANKMCFDVH